MRLKSIPNEIDYVNMLYLSVSRTSLRAQTPKKNGLIKVITMAVRIPLPYLLPLESIHSIQHDFGADNDLVFLVFHQHAPVWI